jgi:hypothetical protein
MMNQNMAPHEAETASNDVSSLPSLNEVARGHGPHLERARPINPRFDL